MTELLIRAASTMNRGRLIKSTLGGVFAVATGLSVGVPRALATNCCTFPWGFCGGPDCTGPYCHSHDPEFECHYDTRFWPNGCWADSCSGGLCCDCECCDAGGGNCAYCGCYG